MKYIDRIKDLANRQKQLDKELEALELDGWLFCHHFCFDNVRVSAWVKGSNPDKSMRLSLEGDAFVVEREGDYKNRAEDVLNALNETQGDKK